ncbi:unnamed protein product, partial [Brenthis ino]
MPSTYAQYIRSSSAPVLVASNTVANSLADTLSLLTVSSLLSDKLPYGCQCPIVAPIAVGSCGCGGCGCGGCGCNGCGCGGCGYGYPYGSYII